MKVRRDVTTVSWTIEGIIGTPISRLDSLSITRKIIERAERERFELAEWEAVRGLSYGEGE